MPRSALQLLQLYLHQRADHGETHIRLSESAKGCLWPSQAAIQPPPASGNPSAHALTLPSPPPSLAAQDAAPAPPQASREERLQKLAEQAATSERCKALGSLRNVMVFAVGNPRANIMFIGEAPGAEEERQREPFVGPAGQLLTRIIQAMGLMRSDVYISNICKYRPAIDDGRPQGARNRPPTSVEMGACLPFILEEIAIIQPKAIVALGSTASTGLGFEGSVSKLRGSFRDFHGTPVMITYHPSYLLRCEEKDGGGVREKRLVWEDILKVMEHVGMPISEKQRGYFTKARS